MSKELPILVQFKHIYSYIVLLLGDLDHYLSQADIKKQTELILISLEHNQQLLKDYYNEHNSLKRIQYKQLASEQLNCLKRYILDASQLNLFKPVDVALLSAKIDQIMDRL